MMRRARTRGRRRGGSFEVVVFDSLLTRG